MAEFDWKRWPEAESLVADLIESAAAGCEFLARLRDRMIAETSTRLADWVDHIVVLGDDRLLARIERSGFAIERGEDLDHAAVYEHQGGLFPRLVLDRGGPAGSFTRAIAIKVDSIADFSRAHDLGLEPQGYPMGPYRSAWVGEGAFRFGVVERRGYRGFDPWSGAMAQRGRLAPHSARDAFAALDLWRGRKRDYSDDLEGFGALDDLLDRVLELAGSPDAACPLVFQAEREFWMSKNRAARVQKARQDRLGLGWANHDHHTFRSSRRFFPHLMKIFRRLGFASRERFHAGEHAGWGAQILEQRTTGVVIFADLDLAPDEALHDFSEVALPDLPRPNTVGLWVGLHGESILSAGMHHLEAQFDFDALRDDLKREASVDMMPPFSDFPFLRQAFTAGERWRVNPVRARRCLELGWISQAEHDKFLAEGAIGSHLENLQRTEGYKGFNQKSVSAILQAVDPRTVRVHS